jgi:hypothetical protein
MEKEQNITSHTMKIDFDAIKLIIILIESLKINVRKESLKTLPTAAVFDLAGAVLNHALDELVSALNDKEVQSHLLRLFIAKTDLGKLINTDLDTKKEEKSIILH